MSPIATNPRISEDASGTNGGDPVSLAAGDLEQGRAAGSSNELSSTVNSSSNHTKTTDSSSLTTDSVTTGETPSVLHHGLIQSKLLQDGRVPPSVLQASATGAGTNTSSSLSENPATTSSNVISRATVTTAPSSVDTRGLPVANTIPSSIQMAEEPVYSAKPVTEGDCVMNKKQAALLTAIVAIIIVVIVTASDVLVKQRRKRHSNRNAGANNNNNNMWWANNQTELYSFALKLPAYTVQVLQKDAFKVQGTGENTQSAWYKEALWNPQNSGKPLSSQGQAWKWLISDPKTTAMGSSTQAYSEDELFTRFALAVLFFATNGPNWDNTTNWLSTSNDADNDLCTWFSSKAKCVDFYPNERIRNYDDYVSWCHRTGFRELRLGSNKLVGTLPPEIGLLTKLTTLSLSSNALTGSLPSTITQLTSLNTLECYSCGLTGNITTLLRQVSKTMVNVTQLRLPTNSFYGSVPVETSKLSKLNDFRLYANKLTGSIADEIWMSWGNLYHLKLNDNKLTGTLPRLLGRMKTQKSFTIHNNLLNGTIPTEIGLMNLQQLDIEGNKISGPYPTELGRLTNLQFLFTSGNLITGTLITEFGLMTSLVYLALESQKKLTGNIPVEFGHLRPTYFYAGDNHLSGTIPTELGSWGSALSVFSLGQNQLTGTIPTALGTFTGCTSFFL
jgi:hypothetical protein